MSHLLQVPPGGATQIDSWHDLMAHQPEDSKLDRILESEGAKPIKGICKSKALKSRYVITGIVIAAKLHCIEN